MTDLTTTRRELRDTLDASAAVGVKLGGGHTSLTLKHKRLEIGGKVYFVATFPEGDLSIHEWSPRNQHGYGDSKITFLLDDGTYETVKGPFCCNDLFNFGRAEMLQKQFGIERKPSACKLRIGKNLARYGLSKGPKEVDYEDHAFSCQPIDKRIASLLSQGFLETAEWEIEYRGGSCYPYPGTIRDYLA
jgi:hypothetical protein